MIMYSTFDAFKPHFEALARAGYFKIVTRQSKTLGLYLHNFYRILIWTAVLNYNLQHIIRALQVRKCTEQLVDTLFILLTTLNSLGKQIAFNVRVDRIDKIIGIINDEIFAPKKPYHEHIMKVNATSMKRLLFMHHISISFCGFLFIMYPLINKALDQPVFLSGYFPFNTHDSPAFELAVTFMGLILTLQAYGHVTMDCTIVSFYAQAKTQLHILRYNLEHLNNGLKLKNRKSFYIDQHRKYKKLIHNNFVDCVKHHGEIVWLVKEVESIFGEATIVQLVVMLWVICMTLYKIVGLDILSAEFLTMGTYLCCMMTQLYIYCYYGTQLKVESELLNDSVYQSSWLSLSPTFRRGVLVMMERCKRTIEPRTAYIIPLSMETYISVLRSSYTLFTILDRK